MTLIFIGASFHNISLTELEILERSADEIRKAVFESSTRKSHVEASVLVSTCNRFEIYFDSDNESEDIEFLKNLIEGCSGIGKDKLVTKTGEEATRHLFRVVSGLESMIVGEVEIAGQVKRAFSISQISSQTSRIIELLFQRSFEVSKRITSQTDLGIAGRSLISSGLEIIKGRGVTLAGKDALVIGTGAYARVVIAALQRSDIAHIGVYSPSDRAHEFAENHGAHAIKSEELHSSIKNADILIACSGTHETVITQEDILNLRERSLPIIDLSLSRDVENSVRNLPHVMLIDLETIAAEAPKEHREVLEQANILIDHAVQEFHDDLQARRNDPYIRLLRSHVQNFVDEEVERVRKRKGEELAKEVQYSLQLVTKSIFHKSMLAARENTGEEVEIEYEKAISKLFGINVTTVEID